MALEAADLKQIADLIKEQMGALKIGDVTASVQALTARVEALGGDVERLRTAPAPAADKDPKGKKPGGKGAEGAAELPDDVTTQLKTLAAQVEEERAARMRAEEARRTEALNTSLTDALTKAGVDPKLIAHARAFVLQSGGIRYDEAKGAHVMDGEIAGVRQPVALADGIAKWAKGDDAKPYLPAKNPTGGTGGGNIEQPAVNGGKPINSMSDLYRAIGIGQA